jgi:hypothetical protein
VGWTTEIRFQAGIIDFSLSHGVQTGSRAYLALYTVGSEGKEDGA